MIFTFLLSITFALPINLSFNWLRSPQLVQEEVDAFDKLLKSAGRMAKVVKNPQIILHQTGIDKAGKPVHGFVVQSAKFPESLVKQTGAKEAGKAVDANLLKAGSAKLPQGLKAGQSQVPLAETVPRIPHGFKQILSTDPKIPEKGFKPGFAQVIGLDGKKAHYLPISRIENEGLDINRLQRLYGFAPPKLTVGESVVLTAGATALVGGGGFAIDAGIKHRKNRLAKEDLAFQIAHGATPENSEIK
jgi:hypothetical protein